MVSAKPPILVLGFRRPDLLLESMEALRGTGIPSLHVSIDGLPKADAQTASDVRECRRVAANFAAEFPVSVQMLDRNEGVYEGIRRGVTWFLQDVGEGIILEDDVRIETKSLVLAREMLRLIDGSKGLGSVSLFNPVPIRLLRNPNCAWRYSILTSSQYWGTSLEKWAQLVTPPRRWQELVSMERLIHLGGVRFAQHWADYLDQLVAENRWSWEVLWTLTHWSNGWSVATSNRNWALHNGFGLEASSAFTRPSWYPTEFADWDESLARPNGFEIDQQADEWAANQRFGLSRVKAFKRWFRTRMPLAETAYLKVRGRA